MGAKETGKAVTPNGYGCGDAAYGSDLGTAKDGHGCGQDRQSGAYAPEYGDGYGNGFSGIAGNGVSVEDDQ